MPLHSWSCLLFTLGICFLRRCKKVSIFIYGEFDEIDMGQGREKNIQVYRQKKVDQKFVTNKFLSFEFCMLN